MHTGMWVYTIGMGAAIFTGEYDIINLLVWLIGFILYRFLMKVDMPLGNTLPDMVITIIICYLLKKIIRRK